MDSYTPTGDSALDLSIFTDYNTPSTDINQFSTSHLIMLPASAITMQGTDNVPFYISPSGKLPTFFIVIQSIYISVSNLIHL